MLKKIIAVCNKKGGVGKTTTCINLGAKLAKDGKKVLLLDLDAQGSLTVGIRAENSHMQDNMACMLQAMIERIDIEPVLNDIIMHHKENIDIIPTSDGLTSVKEMMIAKPAREYFLKKALKIIFTEYDYDHVIIDCPPSIDTLTLNALAAADTLIIPVVPYYLEYQGFVNFFRNLREIKDDINPDLEIAGILLNKYQKQQKLTKIVGEIFDEIEKEYHIRVFKTKISQCVKAAEAPLAGLDIFDFAPTSKTAKEFENLVAEMERGK